MNCIESSRRMKRKRAAKHSGLLVASALAVTMSCAGAFQSSFLPAAQRSSNSPMKLNVVTDPRQLMLMETNEKSFDRNALEDIYLLTTEGEGLSGDLIENTSVRQRRKSSEKVRIKKKEVDSASANNVNSKRIQFKGVSNTVDQRSRSKSHLGRAAPVRPITSVKTKQQKVSFAGTPEGPPPPSVTLASPSAATAADTVRQKRGFSPGGEADNVSLMSSRTGRTNSHRTSLLTITAQPEYVPVSLRRLACFPRVPARICKLTACQIP